MRTVIILSMLLGLQACVSPSKVMSSWVGHTKAELYQKWGPANQVTDDGQGGEILIYSATVNLGQTPGQVYNNGYGGVSYTTPQNNSYNKTRMFYVNRQGVIYSWRWQGL